MENDRIFIVGDIHGCLEMLKRMMDRIDWDPDRDRLIFLGDYVDRGENSSGVLDFILDIARSSPNVQCLMGNHESIFLDFLQGIDYQTFHLNGGGATLSSYRLHRKSFDEPLIPQAHVDFLHSLLPWIELRDYYVVHAGFRPGVPLEDQQREDLIWIREPFIFSDFDFGKPVIFGHTPFAEPLVMENKIGLDTGAVFGNKLTCLELPSVKFHFVEA
ncbi:MAG: serine/threonine protein phosphatase [Deltaproteobacteria bacterium]|nr:serine/threonine protein phosphatase [Deltaproteobacteria bacterium]